LRNHSQIGCGERPFVFALGGELCLFFTRGEKTSASLLRRQKQADESCAGCQNWPERNHADFKKAGEGRKSAKWKTAKQRLGQNAEDEKIDWERDYYRESKTGGAKSENEKTGQKKQRQDVRQICDQQNRDEQTLRCF